MSHCNTVAPIAVDFYRELLSASYSAHKQAVRVERWRQNESKPPIPTVV